MPGSIIEATARSLGVLLPANDRHIWNTYFGGWIGSMSYEKATLMTNDEKVNK